MNKYNDLELAILSCLLQKPELMNQVKLEDKHFLKHKRVWLFLKSIYKKFGTFDITLMNSVCKNKLQMMDYIIWLLELEPAPSLFDKYQQQLIELYNEEEKDKFFIEKVYKYANDLYVRNMSVQDFRNKVDELYKRKEEIK